MRLDKVISSGEEFLRNHSVSSALLNAELLMAHTLKVNREHLYTRPEENLDPEKIETYNSLLKRRINFEPLQYITGCAEFYGRPFIVTRDVLIPRPETELIIDEVKKYSVGKEKLSILDIGTGSGNIAITIKKEIPSAQVFATDISFPAIRIAYLNSRMHNVGAGFFLLTSDLFSAIRPNIKFDIIVSNPPYVPGERIESLQTEIKLYEPVLALDGGKDGMEKIRDIVLFAGQYLKKDGKLIIEIDSTQGKSVISFSDKTRLYKDSQIKKDLAGLDRIFIAIRR
jgi:release factor glutamine methyltransferase